MLIITTVIAVIAIVVHAISLSLRLSLWRAPARHGESSCIRNRRRSRRVEGLDEPGGRRTTLDRRDDDWRWTRVG